MQPSSAAYTTISFPTRSSSANSLNPPLLATFNLTAKYSIPSIFIMSMLPSKSPKTLQNSTPSSSAISAFSAEIIASNDDLLSLILLRLPIKSLLKFKSVSKHWLSIVSDPLFSHRKASMGRPTSSGLFLTRLSPKYDFINLTPFPSAPPFGSLSVGHQTAGILQSCNGLLLCDFNDLSAIYFVYNPTTKQYSRLPQLKGTVRNPFCINGISLAFEPSKSSYYKVVCVRYDYSSPENYQFYIYSSAGGPWRKSRAISSRYVDMSHGVYCNGAIHWISTGISSTYFEMNEETFHEMSMPEIPDGRSDRNVGYVGESGGRLLLMEIYEPETTKFNIYEMEEDRSGWFVKYRVDLETVKLNFPEMGMNDGLRPREPDFYLFSLLFVAEEGEVEDGSYMILNIPGKLIRYNVKSKTWEVIFETDEQEEVYGCLYRWTDAYQYIECLSSV